MNSLQELTLKHFKKSVGQKTFNQYSLMTGIEKTRIFRIFNGAEMKLKEFEVFQSFIREPLLDLKNWDTFVPDQSNLNSGLSFNHEEQKVRHEHLVNERYERMKVYLSLPSKAA